MPSVCIMLQYRNKIYHPDKCFRRFYTGSIYQNKKIYKIVDTLLTIMSKIYIIAEVRSYCRNGSTAQHGADILSSEIMEMLYELVFFSIIFVSLESVWHCLESNLMLTTAQNSSPLCESWALEELSTYPDRCWRVERAIVWLWPLITPPINKKINIGSWRWSGPSTYSNLFTISD